MTFNPLNTMGHANQYNKVLLYAMHGWGKTTQAKYYKEKYGDGFIISGESGLSSIRSSGIDYLPFTSWDGDVDPATNTYSFKSIVSMVRTPEFVQRGYKWIMIDSLTELADMAMEFAEAEANKPENLTKDGKVNNFAIWDAYGTRMIGACKWVRDLPMHVVVTALAKEGEDENGAKDHWPMVKGKQVQTQLPGIFDFVFCGIKRTEQDPLDPNAQPKVMRYTVCDEYKGWHGKARDEKRRLRAVERESNITKLFDRMEMPDDEWDKYVAQQQAQKGGA